jgi:hypothetical protein
MADSRDQKIIDAIIARLETILITGGYQTDIGARVEDSRTNWDQEAGELPAISVFEGPVTSEEFADEGLIVNRTMPVRIIASLIRLDDAAANAAFARKAISDIYRAIRSDDKWVVSGVPLASLTREKSHAIEHAPDSFEITGVQVEIEIEIIANKFDLES